MQNPTYMPQILSDEDGLWWDAWYKPVGYSTAANIKRQILESGVSEERVRIIWKVGS